MVRLNGRIALPTNSSDDDEFSKQGSRRSLRLSFSFGGRLGLAMLALKLKDHLDGFRKAPSEPMVANNDLAPPAYQDDDYDAESAIGLDTSINVPRRTRRKGTCCVCCGLNCSLFCKALGIVVLISVAWNAFKLARWLLTPSSTGLENMPEFSKSLGCLDAAHYYHDSKEGIFYTVSVSTGAEYDLVIDGGAVGTVLLAPSIKADDESVKIRTSLRTSDSRLLNSVEVHTPDVSPLPSSNAPSSSYFSLTTPTQADVVDTCMRYDLTAYIPSTLRTLRIASRSVVQVKFDFANDVRELQVLHVNLSSRADTNLFLPSSGIIAENVNVKMQGGYLVGTLPVANRTSFDTSGSDTVTKLDIFTTEYRLPEPDESDDENSVIARLETVTGAGRTDITYTNPTGRPIWNQHIVKRAHPGTELRLTYKDAIFNGKIDVDAKSYSMRNVQSNGFGSRPGDFTSREFWVGDKDGGDYLKVSTRSWIGLYF